MNKSVFYLLALCASTFLMFTACGDDDSGNSPNLQGRTTIKVTDAPIDDTQVEAVFVTVTDLKVDGQSVEGFNATTVDIYALQNGQTSTLGTFDLDARTYSNLTLTLDYQNDVNGNTPGCYVMTTDRVKHALAASSNELTVRVDEAVTASQNSSWVIDFDLRKSVVRSNEPNDEYDFAATANLEAALRLVNESEAGTVDGNCNDALTTSDKLVVFVYEAGEYDRNTETTANAEGTFFAKAVTSASVADNGDYSLHFLENGSYELVFAAYEENPSTDETELQGTLIVDVIGQLDLGALSVSANSRTTANVVVTGLLPL